MHYYNHILHNKTTIVHIHICAKRKIIINEKGLKNADI